ncbi:MAG: hypothetical protein HS113_17790 [Verrucomicrobiales bacterium]|nr:hypothetical protein [Verrucomicrobiales bacterium]
MSAPNRPPQFLTQPRTQTSPGIPYAYLARARDADGDPLSFELVAGPEGMSAALPDPVLRVGPSVVLQWTPVAAQFGTHAVALAVSDGRPGGTVTQEFTVTVSGTLVNEPPLIVSNPPTQATLDELYQYDLIADDPDQDPVTWALLSGPRGMSLDPLLGTLRWTPGLDQLGTHEVSVSATDPYLASDTQTFEITVNAVNRSPRITSVPPVAAQLGEPYLYAPRASDPDGDRLQWSFAAAVPAGMTIDATTGLVRWQPATAQTGVHVIRIRVEDGRGGSDVQQYSLNAADQKSNHPPVIVSVAPTLAGAGRPYLYRVKATDVDGDALSLQLLVQPPGVVLEPIVAANGVAEAFVRWTPAPDQVGVHDFVVVARDPAGAGAGQRFTVRVRANQAPFITSQPATQAVPSLTWRYDVVASDPEGDPLSYALAEAPNGLLVDTYGRLVWTPAISDIGEHPVTVVVTDAFGAEVSQTFALTVAADTEAPVVELAVAHNLTDSEGRRYVRIGTTVAITVLASDNVGVAERRLLVGGQPVPVSQDGVAMVPFPQSGRLEVVGEASDHSGNTGSAATEVNVVDPNAASAISIVIHSPTNITEVTRPIDITASIQSDVELSEYIVDYAELTTDAADFEMALTDRRLDFQRLNRVTVPANTHKIAEAVVGRFDPTRLLNGMYVIRVTALDANRKGQQEGVGVNVTGDLKFGEFRLEFTDLSIPVAGIPITVTRVYDSRESRRKGDFGFGWRLGVQDARVLEVGKRGGFGFMGDESSFTTATRVYLTTPDGRRVGFAFKPRVPDGNPFFGYPPGYSLLFGQTYNPAFASDPGVYDKLEPLPTYTSGGFVINGDGTFTVPLFGFLGYDPSGYRLTTKDNMVYEYDERLGLKNVTDPNGNRLVYTRGGIAHYPAGATEPDQRVRFERDPLGRISRITDPTGNVLTYTYDHAGDLRAFTDQGSNTTGYAYHALRPHYLETITDPLGREVVRSEYDEAGRLKSITDAAGNTVQQDFDFDQNIGTFTDANGHITYSQYDDRGNETAKWLPGYFTNRFEYDTNNNQVKSVDGRGYVTERRYDARGNLTNIVDALSNVTAIAYNPRNRPTRITDALGRTTRFGYDARGQLTNVLNALGGQAAFTRDPQGRVTSVTDFNGHTTTYDYTGGCSCGKPGKVINPDGTFRLYDYNGYGQLTREENELGHATTYHYDRFGILLWHEDALSNRTEYGYLVNFTGTGLVPRLIVVTDPLRRQTWYGYDAMYRTNTITDANGGVVRFDYDAHGNRTVVTDPVTNTTRFYYDAANRLSHQVDPWGRTNFFAYDPNGNRIEAIDRNGRRRTFGYDALNRRTNEVWWEGETTVRTLSYGFNALGVMTNAVDPASHLTFEFDALNRLERSIQSGVEGLSDFTLTYTYDGMTNVVSVTDNWGVQVLSEYDSRNRLAKRIWQGGEIPGVSLQFAYDAAGFRTNILRFADVAGTQLVGQSHYDYNPVGAMTGILHANGSGETLAAYHYTRDSAQQIIARTLNAQLTTYGYDLTGQLTNAVYNPPTQPDESYTYDLNGNRIVGGYVVSTNNQIIADGTFSYAYDSEGGRVARTNRTTGATTAYLYDYRNRLVGVVDESASGTVRQTVEFTYNALNQRIAKTVNSAIEHFLLNQDHIWVDANATGAITAHYLLGSGVDEMLARYRAGEGPVWYLTDNLGTVRGMADSAGAVRHHISYESFGRIVAYSGAIVSDRFAITGRELDAEVELMHYRARYYDAVLGRFLSIDPIGFAGMDYNLYRYAANQPITSTDPSGTIFVLAEYVVTLGNLACKTVSIGKYSVKYAEAVRAAFELVVLVMEGRQEDVAEAEARMYFRACPSGRRGPWVLRRCAKEKRA